MFTKVRNAFKIKDIRDRLIYTFFALIIVRIGCLITIPGINPELIKSFFDSFAGSDFANALTGGSLESMTIFALNISPYITSSIIMQLLTIAIPKLEELQKDGEDGRKKIAEITRYLTVALAVLQSAAMSIGFANSGYLEKDFKTIAIVVISMTAGSAFLMWLGENITEKGVGNGISIILLINITSRMPKDISNLYKQFIKGADNTINAVISAAVILAVIIFVVVFVVILQDGERRIPVQYSKKVQGRKMVGGASSHIPLKVNTAGVIPVIFASSLLQLPVVISQFFGITPASGMITKNGETVHASVWQMMLKMFSQDSWFNFKSFSEFKYTLGLVVYILLLIFFAYFYTSITFNPIEVSNNMKKQAGFIPGIRPGKPTTDYLTHVLNCVIFIGVTGLAIVAIIPIFFQGTFNANVSFGGTSIIIVVGVVIETLKQVESRMLVRHYKGFLND
ncbi:MAG: preprotein translocase subunit SecY [Lachnospiraceae bacterium]|nr:preprotein translocase subunit SecY [Lachnospiraceae bacterium]